MKYKSLISKNALMLASMLGVFSSWANAQTNTWTAGPSISNWTDGANWSLGVPTAGQTLVNTAQAGTFVNAGATRTVANISPAAEWNFYIQQTGRLDVTGNITTAGMPTNSRIFIQPYPGNINTTLNIGNILVNNTATNYLSIGEANSATSSAINSFNITGTGITFSGGGASELAFNVKNNANLGLISFSGGSRGKIHLNTNPLSSTGLPGAQTFTVTGLEASSSTAKIYGTVESTNNAFNNGAGSAMGANGTTWVPPVHNTALLVNASADRSYGGGLSDGIRGTLSLTKNGTATQTLSGSNTYTGATTINAGALKLGAGSASNGSLGFGGLITANSTVNGTTVGAAGTLDLNGKGDLNEVVTLNGGKLSNTGGTEAVLSKGVAGVSMSASGSNYFLANGTESVDRSIVVSGGGGSGGAGAAMFGLTEASLNIAGGTGFVVGDELVVNGGVVSRYGVVVVTSVDGGGGITGVRIADPGLYYGVGNTPVWGPLGSALSSSQKFLLPAGRTAPTTATYIDGNMKLMGVSLSSGGDDYTSAPTISMQSGGSITAQAVLSEVILAADSRVGGTADIHIKSNISGAGDLTKEDSNLLTLSGVNSGTGDINVDDGSLLLAASSNTIFAIGDSGVNRTINAVLSDLQVEGTFTFDLSSAGSGLGDTWQIVNSLTATYAVTFSVGGFNDEGAGVWSKVNGMATYEFDQNTGALSVTAVPEPSTWMLLGTGMLTMALVLRRRRTLRSE